MNVCNRITEREEINLCIRKNQTSICNTLDDNPESPKIPLLQSNIPPLKTRILDITKEIWLGYFAFESHIPCI